MTGYKGADLLQIDYVRGLIVAVCCTIGKPKNGIV